MSELTQLPDDLPAEDLSDIEATEPEKSLVYAEETSAKGLLQIATFHEKIIVLCAGAVAAGMAVAAGILSRIPTILGIKLLAVSIVMLSLAALSSLVRMMSLYMLSSGRLLLLSWYHDPRGFAPKTRKNRKRRHTIEYRPEKEMKRELMWIGISALLALAGFITYAGFILNCLLWMLWTQTPLDR